MPKTTSITSITDQATIVERDALKRGKALATECNATLARIAAHIHREIHEPRFHYGHAGDLAKALDSLKDVERFLSNGKPATEDAPERLPPKTEKPSCPNDVDRKTVRSILRRAKVSKGTTTEWIRYASGRVDLVVNYYYGDSDLSDSDKGQPIFDALVSTYGDLVEWRGANANAIIIRAN